MRVEKDMEDESEGCTTRNNNYKVTKWLKEIGIKTQITELQKTLLLHNAQILQKVFEV